MVVPTMSSLNMKVLIKMAEVVERYALIREDRLTGDFVTEITTAMRRYRSEELGNFIGVKIDPPHEGWCNTTFLFERK